MQNSAEAAVLREMISQYFIQLLTHSGLKGQQPLCPLWKSTLLREDSIVLIAGETLFPLNSIQDLATRAKWKHYLQWHLNRLCSY